MVTHSQHNKFIRCVGSITLLIASLVVSGCASTSAPDKNTTPTASSPSTEATPSQATPSAKPSPEEKTESPETPNPKKAAKGATTPQGFALPEGAYAGAGGPIPADATEVTAIYRNEYTHMGLIVTPSGNIGCDLGTLHDEKSEKDQSASTCTIFEVDQAPHTLGPNGPDDKANCVWWNDEGAALPCVQTDASLFQMQNPPAQVVPYGKVVYKNSIACASERNGLTCWDTRTGHGTFLNKQKMHIF